MLEARLDKEMPQGAAAEARAFPRYAIAFTPAPGTKLAAFGRSWFGRGNEASTFDAFSGFGLSGLGEIREAALAGRYPGLNVTFKAPFALRAGKGPDALKARLDGFTRSRKALATGPLTIVRDGRVLTLRPAAATPDIDWLANQCVNAFDGFAAALSPNDRIERLTPHLTPYQRLLLESFGDTNVLSEFRFAITLTGPLEPAEVDRVAEALSPLVREICDEGISVDALSLLGDPGNKRCLRLISRHRFCG